MVGVNMAAPPQQQTNVSARHTGGTSVVEEMAWGNAKQVKVLIFVAPSLKS